MDKLKSSTAMSKLCCITDLIRFMMNEAEMMMKGSVHEEDFFIVHNALVSMKAKETINWMINNGYLHRWLLPLNGQQDGTPYSGRPVGNIPEIMPLDNLLNRDILHSLRMHSVLICYIVDREETDKEESNMYFSYSTPREISRGLKRIWDSKMGTPSSVRMIKDVDLALKALEIIYRANGAAVEGLADRNGHRCKEVGEGKSVSCGGAQTKGEGRECELTKNMFFHSDLFQLCHKKKWKITEFFPDTTVFYD